MLSSKRDKAQYSFTNLYSITPHYQIMDKLLDKEVHQLYKAPSLVNYLGVKTPSSSVSISTSSNPGTSPNPLPPGAGAEAASTPRTGSMASGGASAQPTVNSPSEVNTVPNRASAGARPKITYPLRYNRYVSIHITMYRFPICNHHLPIESERWVNIPRNERICNHCNKQEIGDEFHYILNCTSLQQQRVKYLTLNHTNIKNVFSFKQIMASDKHC